MSWESPTPDESAELSRVFGGEWTGGLSPYGPGTAESEPAGVSAVLSGVLGDGTPLRVSASWGAADPFAVVLEFGSGPVWVVGRDLLAEGCESESPVGLGDVRCWSAGPAFMLSLSDPDGSGGAVVSFPRSQIVGFVSDVFEACPAGAEWVDWDSVVCELLSSGRWRG